MLAVATAAGSIVMAMSMSVTPSSALTACSNPRDCATGPATASPTATSTTDAPIATPTPEVSEAKPSAADATVSSGPTASVTPTASAPATATGPAQVHGTFTLGNGTALANYPVTLTATDLLPAEGQSADPTVVGTTTTAADGTWTFTVPDTLPAAVQTLVNANNGILNLDATVTGTAPDGTVLSASDTVTAGVAHDAASTADSARVRAEVSNDSVALTPGDPNAAEATVPDDTQTVHSYSSMVTASGDATQIDATPPQYQSNTSGAVTNYNPQVIAGVDYSAVVPDRTAPCSTGTSTLKTGIYYTVMGETHAYWDATAGFEYANKLSTTWTVAYSNGGNIWKVSGKVSHSENTGHTISVAGMGPHWAHQIQLPMKYAEVESVYRCLGIVKSRTYKILPVGYAVPPGGQIGRVGADVSARDGAGPYNNSNPAYRTVIDPYFAAAISGGNSLTYGTGVTAFGVSLSTDTSYDTGHTEKITAGHSKAYEHDIWGKYDNYGGKPGVIYSF